MTIITNNPYDTAIFITAMVCTTFIIWKTYLHEKGLKEIMETLKKRIDKQ